MQPCKQTQTSLPSTQWASTALQQRIPWWDDLAPAVRAELELPATIDLPQQICDVIVIGGGVAGLSAALSARAAGAQVVLLEREAGLGYGATGRNAGILSAGINMGLSELLPDDPLITLWLSTTHLLLSLIEEAQQPDSLLSAHLIGALILAESKHAVRYLTREARARLAAGLHIEQWTPTQVAEATSGRLNVQSVQSALWLPDEGRIHPLTLLAHLAQQVRAQDIVLAGLAQVDSVEESRTSLHGPHWQVTLHDGHVLKTRALIQATGPTARPNARIYALAFTADLPETFPLFWDASPYTYADFRPGNGRLGVSGGRYGKAGMLQHDERYHARLAALTRRWLPELAGQEPQFKWAVDLYVTPDLLPQLQPLRSTAPGFSIEGLGALGVLPGMVLGHQAGQLATS
jgi:glycine/D-amino acid oxidase-like deaminating enzyme